jgi:hypothetical protein
MCDGTHSLIRITSSSDNRFQQLSSSQLSIRFGSKARPAARDSVIKHHVFGVKTRNRGNASDGSHCRKPAENFIRIRSHSRRGISCAWKKTDIRPSWGFAIADAGEGRLFPLAAIPENADFHTPENPLLLWKSYVGISAA